MAAPEQPKKVTGGAYGRYLAEHRAALTEECKGKPATAVVKLASERFKALTDAERASYQEQYTAATQQYEKDMEAFTAAGGEKKGVVRKSAPEKPAKKERDPEAPKKPVGGSYGVFSNEKREEFTQACAAKGEKGFGPVAKMTSEAFKALGEAEKAGYEAKYNERVAAYRAALAAHSEKRAAEGPAAPVEASPPAAKRARKAASPAAATPKLQLEASVAAAAEKAGLLDGLTNLAGRPEVVAKGLKQAQLLEALRESGGLVNKAKAALLGGA